MSGISIRIDPAGFEPFMRQVSRIEAAIPRAIAQGLNEGGDKVRTQVMRTLWKQTGLTRYASVTSRVRTARAHEGGLSYQIVVPGKPPIPITEWPVTVRTGPGGGVDAKTWGVDHLFKRSFQEAGGALRARTTSKRFPIRKLYGPSLAKELVSERGTVPTVFIATASAEVPRAILKRLAKVM